MCSCLHINIYIYICIYIYKHIQVRKATLKGGSHHQKDVVPYKCPWVQAAPDTSTRHQTETSRTIDLIRRRAPTPCRGIVACVLYQGHCTPTQADLHVCNFFCSRFLQSTTSASTKARSQECSARNPHKSLHHPERKLPVDLTGVSIYPHKRIASVRPSSAKCFRGISSLRYVCVNIYIYTLILI